MCQHVCQCLRVSIEDYLSVITQRFVEVIKESVHVLNKLTMFKLASNGSYIFVLQIGEYSLWAFL